MADNSFTEIRQAVKDGVKKKLNNEKVKLWLPPYTKEDGTFGEYPQDFVKRFSETLNLSPAIIIHTFEELRQHALTKLAKKRRFEETGFATLSIKIPENCVKEGVKKSFDVTLKLEEKGDDLRQIIAVEIHLPKDTLKIIANGRVLKNDESLKNQGVNNQSHVMVVLLSESERKAKQREDSVSAIQRTKDAAQLLAKKKYGPGLEDDRFCLQIADQNGKPIDLPPEEREALSVALTLNEKGRACLKKKDYAGALPFLLEAEGSFSRCRSDILEAVDNFAVVCLDIVWCYLCLEQVDQLPNAEQKLKICEESFRRAHGPNMERLQNIKGDKGKDLALYVKLYLLQGILAYHQGNIFESRRLLEKTESILKSIQVDESKLMQLVGMGYEVPEARLGLRASHGNISEAIAKITEIKERKKQLAKKDKDDRRKAKLAKKFGKSVNGEWIKVDVYEKLMDMGFPGGVAVAALKQTNSDLNSSLEAIESHPEWYDIPEPVMNSTPSPDWNGAVTDAMIARLTEMGFDVNTARDALLMLHGNVEKAVQELMKHGGQLPSTSTGITDHSEEKFSVDELKAMSELAPDIPEHDEDYLDVTLIDEAQFLEEYTLRLASAASTASTASTS